MPIAVRCPNAQCKRLVRVAETLQGKTIRCPACGASLRIPATPGAAPRAADSPAPASLDDLVDGPSSSGAGRGASQAPGVADRVADSAAGVTRAISPLVKLLLALVFLGGLVYLSTQVIFPMLWAKKPISSVTTQELDEAEAAARAREAEIQRQRRPLDDERRARVNEAIAEGDLARARRLLDTLRGDPTVDPADIGPLELSLRDALETRIQTMYADAEKQLAEKSWDAARAVLEEIAKLDSGERGQERFKGYDRQARAGRAVELLAASREAAKDGDYDTATDLATQASVLDSANREIPQWIGVMANERKAGVRFNTGGVVADVFLDNRKVGDSSRTIWRLEGRRYMTFRLNAPGHVPLEVVDSLNYGAAKTVNVHLVPAVPDGLWVASLFENDACRWLALRALSSGGPGIADAIKAYEERCRKATVNPRKRNVWRVKMGAETRHALEYSVLGTTVRFIDLATSETVRTTTDKIAKADEIPLEEGARMWLEAIAARADKAPRPCDAFREFAKFVEVFPDLMDRAFAWSAEPIERTARRLVEVANCKTSEPREAMTVRARLEAEIAAWGVGRIPPPQALAEQKKSLP